MVCKFTFNQEANNYFVKLKNTKLHYFITLCFKIKKYVFL